MSRPEPEDSRRQQLIEATIDTLADHGFAATTLAGIGARAGVSPGLIAHYFADKDGLLEATLRSLARHLTCSLTGRLRAAGHARARVQAVIETMLAPEQFEPRTCSVWLAFWGEVSHSVRLRRVQRVYQGRMLSNLRHALRQLVEDADADRISRGLAAMIDGLWLRATLSTPQETDSVTARAMAFHFVEAEISRCGPRAARSDRSLPHAVPVIHHVIAGASVPAGRTVDVLNPANGTLQARLSVAGEGEISAALEAARAVQPAWAGAAVEMRARTLVRFSEQILIRQEDLARLAACAMGTPLRAAQAQLGAVADDILRLAAMVLHLSASGGEGGAAVSRAPLGVLSGQGGRDVASLVRICAAALGTGNGLILHPAAWQSELALELAGLAAIAGVPPGLLNVLHGDEEAASLLAADPRADGALIESVGPHGFIVLEDADVNSAARHLLASHSGARCYVEASVAEAFIAAGSSALASQVMGDPLAGETDLGPLPSAGAQEAFAAGVESLLAGGGTLVAGGDHASAGIARHGFFVSPAVIVLETDEPVAVPAGPVFVISPVADAAAAIAAANTARLPLVDVFTRNLARGCRVASGLHAMGSALNMRSRFPLRALVETSTRPKNLYVAAEGDTD